MSTNHLSQFLEQITFSDLSAKSVEEAKNAVIDTLGICIRGSSYESSKVIYSCLETINTDSDDKSGLWGLDQKASSTEAAFYNSATAHTVEMDDWHRDGTVHPGCVVIPAALAIAEAINASGKDLLVAIASGYEIVARIGMAAQGTQQERGFHPTGTCGVFGAAAAAGKLYGLSKQQLNMAFGIAGSFTGGLLEYQSNGAWTKRLNPASATKAGVYAAKLAEAGFIGPETILEGKAGFLKAYSNSYSLEIIDNLSSKDTLQIEKISRKPYPSCRHTHAAIDAILNIFSKSDIAIEDIKEINVESYDRVIEATMRPEERKYRPQSQVDGQFSLPFCLALAVYYREIAPEYFSEEFFKQNKLLELTSKVKASATKELNDLYPAQNPARVIVKTGSAEYSNTVYDPKGDPENPLTAEMIDNKFIMLAKPVIGQAKSKSLLEALHHLEQLKTIRDLSSS